MADLFAAVVLSGGAGVFASRRLWLRHQRGARLARLTAQRLARDVTSDLARLAERTEALSVRCQLLRRALSAEPAGALEARIGLDLLEEFHTLLLTELQRAVEQALRGRRLASRRAALLALRAHIRTAIGEIDDRRQAWDQGERVVSLPVRAAWSGPVPRRSETLMPQVARRPRSAVA